MKAALVLVGVLAMAAPAAAQRGRALPAAPDEGVVTPAEIQTFHCYDGFSPQVLWTLERFGFCAPGAAADFIGKGSFKGQARVRVQAQRATGGGPAFFAGGNLMKIVYDAP